MTTQSFTTDTLQDVLGFPFEDENWVNKFVIGSVVVIASFLLLGIPYLALVGYGWQLRRKIINEGSEPKMPEWEDWGALLSDGLKGFAVGFVYYLPLILIFCAGYAALFGLIIIPAEANGGDLEGPMAILPVIGVFGFIIAILIVMGLGLALGLFVPVATSRVIATDQISAAFQFGQVWSIFKVNWGGFVMAFVIVLALSIALNFALQILQLTIIGCCLFPFIIPAYSVYAILIQNALVGQAYRTAMQRLAEEPSLSA